MVMDPPKENRGVQPKSLLLASWRKEKVSQALQGILFYIICV